jgi:hypothetical protein
MAISDFAFGMNIRLHLFSIPIDCKTV